MRVVKPEQAWSTMVLDAMPARQRRVLEANPAELRMWRQEIDDRGEQLFQSNYQALRKQHQRSSPESFLSHVQRHAAMASMAREVVAAELLSEVDEEASEAASAEAPLP